MSAYAIVDLDVHDIEAYLKYQKSLRPLLEGAGGRYLARGGETRVFDGDYQPSRIILLEFPSLAAMEEFYESEAYQALEPERLSCSSARMIGVEGL